jgi:hypothetical protein
MNFVGSSYFVWGMGFVLTGVHYIRGFVIREKERKRERGTERKREIEKERNREREKADKLTIRSLPCSWIL